MKDYRVWAEVNLDALAANLAVVRGLVGPDVRILAVVKADGYGHGAIPVSWKALQAGAHALGVGDSSEAIELRESGITGDIVILGAIIEEEISRVIQYDIIATVHSRDFLRRINDEAKRQNREARVHLKVDTGMGRLGASPREAIEIAREIKNCPRIKLDGLATHFSTITSPHAAYTDRQMTLFRSVIDELAKLDIHPANIHAAHSSAMVARPDARFTMIRVGISMYGIDPGIFAPRSIRLTPILTLKTRIAYLKGITGGSSIGYEQTWQAAKRTRLATLPVGYNDGYPFALSNKGEVLIRGKRAPIRGTVTMDYIMVDVGVVAGITPGDIVTLIGRDGDDEIPVTELAKKSATTPYEITCRLGKRVKRVYK